MQGFAHPPGRHLPRWGTPRLRMTLWYVAVLALILGDKGGAVRYNKGPDSVLTESGPFHAGAEGLEPPTLGFGDRCSTS